MHNNNNIHDNANSVRDDKTATVALNEERKREERNSVEIKYRKLQYYLTEKLTLT